MGRLEVGTIGVLIVIVVLGCCYFMEIYGLDLGKTWCAFFIFVLELRCNAWTYRQVLF